MKYFEYDKIIQLLKDLRITVIEVPHPYMSDGSIVALQKKSECALCGYPDEITAVVNYCNGSLE